MQIDYYYENNIIGKEVVIDWFQVTFDFIPVTYVEEINRYVLDKKNPKFIELIKILNPESDLIKTDYALYIDDLILNLVTKQSGRYRFDNGYMINEHIELSFGGNKTAKDTYPVILIMTGQGCREFERAGGNWINLFKFILENATGHLKIGRLDIAIDDFDGKEITPYQIEEHIRNHHYISPFRKVNYNITELHSNNPTTEGFAITFGSRGSNQLQIYDKNLERRSNKEIDKNTNVWFRYEMRFTEEMAYTVLTRYIEAFDLNDSLDFMTYMKGVLKSLLDIKEFNPNNSQKTRWKTLQSWDNFLNSLEKVDIKRLSKVPTTIHKKIDWFKEDMATTLLQFALIYEGDDFQTYINEVISSADFKQKHLNMINNYFIDKEKELINMQDVKELQNEFTFKETLSDQEKLMDLFKKLDRDLEGFIYSGVEEEGIYLSGYEFNYKLVDEDTYFSEFENVIYISKKELNRYIIFKNYIKEKIEKLKNL